MTPAHLNISPSPLSSPQLAGAAECSDPPIVGIKPFIEDTQVFCHGLNLGETPGGFGFENFSLRFRVCGMEQTIEKFQVLANTDRTLQLEAKLSDGLVARWDLERIVGGVRLLGKVRLENQGKLPLLLEEASFGQVTDKARFLPGPSHVLGWGLRYAHTGNLRTEQYPLCAADYPYVRQLPIKRRVLGNTEDQPFPGLYVFNEESGWGIVFAQGCQIYSTPVFTLCRNPLFRPDVFSEFLIHWDFPQAEGIPIPPGKTIELDSLYLQIQRGTGPEQAFEDYLEWLSSGTPFRGATTPVNSAALHCTWNYGVFANQSAGPLLKTARFISEKLPSIRFFLVDDGYLAHTAENTRVYLNRFYPEPENELLESSWPGGMRAFTTQLRSLGLRPGIWWTPTVRIPCPLLEDHPDWFLRKKDGTLYLIGENNAYLDYSHPDALDFLDRTLSVILGKWGMDACKIDFWSQNFETREAALFNPHLTGIEVRRRFLKTVRRHLPSDGVIMSCIAMGMGNPFTGEEIDTYRCSMDITDGLWHEQINNCLWTLPLLGFGGRRSSLLNTDSVGINLALPNNENFFRLTWCYITMGLIETGGRLEELPKLYFEAMKKLTERSDRGYPCRCPDKRAYTGVPLAECLYVDFPAKSPTGRQGIRQSIAFFNWTDQPCLVSVNRDDFGQPESVIAEDFWHGGQETWTEEFTSVVLEPRCARLFDISW